ncbi:hypothetical protein PG587_09110 [Riemerella anatipestifer]|uniref:hypothetical protein n=1 Tax=Riemerella anatipestifer TaxID=34085 RepID=UPI0012B1C6B2|nr:hypothetical protein [Riemerella anatipestifer]MDY3507022.1 hypothetical protein [Riemerella anatipestifer]MSN81985.1 hypothetical protein [Riemerella anatipestifer]UXN81036.1 hypothetical protein [Phage vB_RanS_PJN03]
MTTNIAILAKPNINTSKSGKEGLGKMIYKTLEECDNIHTADDLMLVAYAKKVPNYDQIEKLYHSKFSKK